MPANWKLLAFFTVALGLIAMLAPSARAGAPFVSTGQGMMDHRGMMGGNRGMTGKMPMMGMQQMMEHCRQMMQGMNGGRPNDRWRDRNPEPKN